MKRFYALQPEFYDCVRKQPQILYRLHTIEEPWKSKVFIRIDPEELQESGSSYFQKDLHREDDCIFYEHYLKSQIYMADCHNGFVRIDNKDNPFYALLKRKYPYHVILDEEHTADAIE